jgi:ribonuclease P protein subunit POP4
MNESLIVKDELIGREVKIKNCTDPSWTNKTGTIIDETKNTFLIESKGQQKRIVKNIASFEFEYKGKKIIIEGSRLTYRSEDRIKKAR